MEVEIEADESTEAAKAFLAIPLLPEDKFTEILQITSEDGSFRSRAGKASFSRWFDEI
jgi:hypothetical protein